MRVGRMKAGEEFGSALTVSVVDNIVLHATHCLDLRSVVWKMGDLPP